MKAFACALSCALVALAATAHASPREVREYLARAGDRAAAQVAAAGVDVGDGLDVKARVNADGRLTGIHVEKSTGSVETDQAAVKALKRLRVQGPPNSLLGADVHIAVGKAPLVAASGQAN